MTEYIVPSRVYFTIFAILILLTATTVGAAFIDLGRMNNVVALTIAVSKATLVILYFMHVRYGTRLTWLVVASGFTWLVLLITLTLSDVLTRGWLS
jgi:cytochrome c oxidase subunit 4